MLQALSNARPRRCKAAARYVRGLLGNYSDYCESIVAMMLQVSKDGNGMAGMAVMPVLHRLMGALIQTRKQSLAYYAHLNNSGDPMDVDELATVRDQNRRVRANKIQEIDDVFIYGFLRGDSCMRRTAVELFSEKLGRLCQSRSAISLALGTSWIRWLSWQC